MSSCINAAVMCSAMAPISAPSGDGHHHRDATVPPQVAFDVLRTVSQNRNIPLRQVAAGLVARTINSAPSGGG
jgi:hypothetical protein